MNKFCIVMKEQIVKRYRSKLFMRNMTHALVAFVLFTYLPFIVM